MTFSYRTQHKPRKEGRMTTEEYLATEETVLPRELSYGVWRVADSPNTSHQRMVGRLHLAMVPAVEQQRSGEVLLAPMDVVLDFDAALVVQPDLIFISNERADTILADRVYGAPDLAVEILSPFPRIGSLNERLGWFAKYGVRECWLVDLTAAQYAILTLGITGVEARRICLPGDPVVSSVLPGVTLPLMAKVPYGK